MSKRAFASLASLASLAALSLLIGTARGQQQENQNPVNQKIEAAAKKLLRGLADGDVTVVKERTAGRYARSLSEEKLRLVPTGPKLKVSYSDSVSVVRSTPDSAVVEATFFSPESNETPAGEVGNLRVYLVQEHGEWFASAPSEKEAGSDAGDGGFYHSGRFTFCPNKGFVFAPNHFSIQLSCQAAAACR